MQYFVIPKTFYYLTVGISFLVSLGLLKKGTPRHLFAFSLFLFVTLCAEALAIYVKIAIKTNHPVYNVFAPIEFLFYSYFFYFEVKSGLIRTIIKCFWIAFSAFTIGNLVLFQGFLHFNTVTNTFGSIFIILILFNFFYEKVASPSEQSLISQYSFWIASGLLVYTVLDVPFTGILNYLNNNKMSREVSAFFQFGILRLANIIMYSFFATGFICYYKTRK